MSNTILITLAASSSVHSPNFENVSVVRRKQKRQRQSQSLIAEILESQLFVAATGFELFRTQYVQQFAWDSDRVAFQDIGVGQINGKPTSGRYSRGQQQQLTSRDFHPEIRQKTGVVVKQTFGAVVECTKIAIDIEETECIAGLEHTRAFHQL